MTRFISWITEYSYRKAWLVMVAVVMVVAFGGYTVTRVRQELIPDIELPMITVVVQVPDTQATDLTQSVTVPLESQFEQLDGVKSLSSTTVAGLSVVTAEYDFGANLESAEDDIRRAIDQTPLPTTAQVSVLKFDPTLLPIVEFSLEGELSQSELLTLAQTEVLPFIRSLDGVASVEVVGGASREVIVTLDASEMVQRGVTYQQVTAALQANNVLIPSGALQTPEFTQPIETVAVLQTLDSIRSITVQGADGQPVRLGEIATVEDVQAASTGVARTNGKPAVSIRVTKEKSANTVETSHRVLDELKEIEERLPEGAAITIFSDQAEYIEESISGVIEEGIIGGVLAIIIVFIFLSNWRTTLVTAVSIPLSILVAVILLDRMGYSLNIMTLGGLTIAIGRVIDDSIVVLENVYRHMAEGQPPFAAIVNGAREVTIAIVGATATTCAVFLPLGMVGGLVGQLFLSFSLAVAFALLASLIVAVTVIPALAKFTIAGKVKAHPEKKATETRLARAYAPILRWSLKNRWKTLGIAAAAFVASLALVPLLPVVFLPPSGENIVTVTVNARPGQTQDAVLEQAIAVEELLQDYDLVSMQTIITGATSDIGAIGNILMGQGANSATIRAEFGSGDRQDIANDLRERIAAELPNSENISVTASGGDFDMGSGISFTVSAENEQAAQYIPEVAQKVAEAVASVEHTANVSSDVGATIPTLQVVVDPERAAAAGVSPALVAERLGSLSSNATVTNVDLGNGPQRLRVVVGGVSLADRESLEAFEVAPGVAIRDVADIIEVARQVSITRVDGRPAATITADITDIDSAAVSADALAAVKKIDLPDGIEVYQGGIAADIEEGFSSLFFAIGASVVLVYVIMVILFQSWLDPFVILFSLPLAVIGAIVALVVTGSPLSVSALIGILMLVGIVVTNAIVMLEFVIMLRHERGYSTYEALMEGAQTRLRPILMTAIAAMLALIPLSLGLTEGALIAADLGRVVIGGLFSSTMLTLVVVPVVYSLVDDLKRKLARAPQTERRAAATREQAAQG